MKPGFTPDRLPAVVEVVNVPLAQPISSNRPSQLLPNAVGEFDDSCNADLLHDEPMYLQIFFEARLLRMVCSCLSGRSSPRLNNTA